MFSKVLIANRGEIACRVIDTCRELGVKAVAVYSDADQFSRHVAMADEAVHIGPSAVSESYLQMERIIEAAQKTGAEAIHPGFGFLSENPEFVDKVEAAGLTFIGPSAVSIRAMGLKDGAKKLMEEAGVPVVPGYHGDEQDADYLAREAAKIGYPVLIKARAGGGGKGMRLVERPDDFTAALESAKREGKASFGDGRVLVEKYINAPRHIEVQVFGDSHGNVVHLFERDCSLQRRHQKVIEEAPAPGMTDKMRAAMTNAAVMAAKAIDYEGAGTIEFIVDGTKMSPDGFWFMEMNTRLQVEHPVTEEITGLDLVAWQLRVASGEPLPRQQDEIVMSGHAFEARLYAEDAENDFLPAIGTLNLLDFPNNTRIETGVRQGDEITPHYDPMIAKLITHGTDRAEALTKLANALDETHVIGSVTNVAFLGRLCRHSGFQNGEVDTGLIARDLSALTEQAAVSNHHLAGAALSAFGALIRTNRQQAWNLWGAPSRLVKLRQEESGHTLRVTKTDEDQFSIRGDDVDFEVQLVSVANNGDVCLDLNGVRQTLRVCRFDNEITVFIDGTSTTFILQTGERMGASEAASSNQVVAPMPGSIIACHVSAGDRVEKGQALLVMEAMKMEHALEASMDGVVTDLSATLGDQVEKGAILATLADD